MLCHPLSMLSRVGCEPAIKMTSSGRRTEWHLHSIRDALWIALGQSSFDLIVPYTADITRFSMRTRGQTWSDVLLKFRNPIPAVYYCFNKSSNPDNKKTRLTHPDLFLEDPAGFWSFPPTAWKLQVPSANTWESSVLICTCLLGARHPCPQSLHWAVLLYSLLHDPGSV